MTIHASTSQNALYFHYGLIPISSPSREHFQLFRQKLSEHIKALSITNGQHKEICIFAQNKCKDRAFLENRRAFAKEIRFFIRSLEIRETYADGSFPVREASVYHMCLKIFDRIFWQRDPLFCLFDEWWQMQIIDFNDLEMLLILTENAIDFYVPKKGGRLWKNNRVLFPHFEIQFRSLIAGKTHFSEEEIRFFSHLVCCIKKMPMDRQRRDFDSAVSLFVERLQMQNQLRKDYYWMKLRKSVSERSVECKTSGVRPRISKVDSPNSHDIDSYVSSFVQKVIRSSIEHVTNKRFLQPVFPRNQAEFLLNYISTQDKEILPAQVCRKSERTLYWFWRAFEEHLEVRTQFARFLDVLFEQEEISLKVFNELYRVDQLFKQNPRLSHCIGEALYEIQEKYFIKSITFGEIKENFHQSVFEIYCKTE